MRRFLIDVAVGIACVVSASTNAYGQLPSGSLDYAAVKGGSGAVKWLSVVALDIGQGNCILVTCPNGDQTIYDCGSSEGYSTRAEGTNEFFRNVLVSPGRLNAIVVSHGDIDHVNKLSEILSVARITSVDSFYYGGQRNTYITNAINQAGVASANVFGANDSLFATGPTLRLGCTAAGSANGVSILANNVNPSSSNDSSVVARIVSGSFSVLLTGDMERQTEEAILRTFSSSLPSTVAVITHHGSANRTNLPSFVTGVSPKVAVLSAGGRSADYAHPRCLVKALYEAVPTGLAAAASHPITCYEGRNQPTTDSNYTKAVFNTHDSGAVMTFSDGAQFSVWTCPSVRDLSTCTQVVAPRSARN